MKFDYFKFQKIGENVEASQGVASDQSIDCASSLNVPFRLEDVKANADSDNPMEKNKALAYGAYKYAEVIAENFGDAEIDYMVAPHDIDPDANKDALPIHFLFKKNGKPKVAVVIVTAKGYRTPRVVATRLWCKKNDVKYIRMHADGNYADWITGESNGAFDNRDDLVAYCKNWVVTTIKEALN